MHTPVIGDTWSRHHMLFLLLCVVSAVTSRPLCLHFAVRVIIPVARLCFDVRIKCEIAACNLRLKGRVSHFSAGTGKK